ncbi:MAG: hypothetical protein A2Y62_17475 [Candidatus Fischerbacteria bacterium RBG_13_37_8]|uniref:Bulb-type lectin domain-containing protein n=1 Tax=Candidatus Fischerbacteria bacterium RBG_13_37_8 TaxID=1817863 RepID=A0A1F5VSZ1_9BACT|nr:MAG: hypothetical protein A2Y62_17475 [Candidatus Fischerbacteria bacterium RBG_13_37_8]
MDGEYVITGEKKQNIVLLKLDSSGTIVWQYFYGEITWWDYATSVEQDISESYIVTGLGHFNVPDLIVFYKIEMTSRNCNYRGSTALTTTASALTPAIPAIIIGAPDLGVAAPAFVVEAPAITRDGWW